MAKNSDVIARNELLAARKEKAKAILDDVAKTFNLWTHISNFVKYGSLFSLPKDDALLPELLKTGYIEIVEPEPCEKALSVNLSDSNRIALQPTEKGLTAYYWFTKYNQQCRETKAAYIQGKKDALIQIFSNLANSLDLDSNFQQSSKLAGSGFKFSAI